VLLGPQGDYDEVAQALDDVGASGRVALVTAGWQENEAEDSALVDGVRRASVNLRLHGRAQEVAAADPEFAQAWSERQERLQHMQEFYRMRLDAADDAARAIAVRHVDDDLLREQVAMTVAQLQHLDSDHLARCRAVHAAFDARWTPWERAVVAEARAAIAEALDGCDAVVISGGHVVSLLNRMRLFGLVDLVGGRPIVAWSAGAMALTERVVLFHDFPPFGKNIAQVLDAGEGLCPGVVAMPDAATRVNTSEREGIARFAARMAPAHCVLLDTGARVDFDAGGLADVRASRLAVAGEVELEWNA
jgi:hypothetical protein